MPNGEVLDSVRVDFFRPDSKEAPSKGPRWVDDPTWCAEDWRAGSDAGADLVTEEPDLFKSAFNKSPCAIDSPTSSGSLQQMASRVTFDNAGGDDLSEPFSPSSSAARMPRQASEITLHKVWSPEDGVLRSTSAKRMKSSNDRKPNSRGRSNIRSGQEIQNECCLHHVVQRPNGYFCLFWDIVCTVAIAHDTVMIPLLSAFPLIQQEGLPEILEAVSGCVWMVDIVVSFLRGFIDMQRGLVEMRLQKIAYRYVTTWFIPDAAMVFLDGLSLFMVELRQMEALTLLRLFRNLRLVRLLKMTNRFRLLKDVITSMGYGSEGTSVFVETVVGVLKHLALIALLCHFTGCAWHAIGGLTGTTWVTVHTTLREQDIGIFNHNWMYLYMTSVHWSLTQFTPAAMDVVAVNALERVFSVVVTLAGLIVFSLFLGSINQNLARLRNLNAQERLQNRLVRRYVSERRISVELAAEILAWIKQRRRGKANSKIVFSDIKALENLPSKLLTDLQQEVGIPVLESHAMLKHLAGLGYQDAVRLCSKALNEVSRVFGEELFHSGSSSDKMYFVRSGRLHYTWELRPQETEDVFPQSRVGEASLWLQVEYCGRLACADHSAHLFYLDADIFRKVLSKSEHMEVLTVYARLFSKLFLAQKEIDMASDLFGDDKHVATLMRRLRALQVGVSVLFTADRHVLNAKPVFLAWKEVVQAKPRRAGGSCWPFGG
ncbi:unnamed protein product [Symbiodinium natans]|uniref:Cyclic nucleotide-binding domain-containing protein n=1 Tax=Symbiodinium natans TaxID=878477 RepID=A0A812I596_9DINO|nr:unnamed protein product [Symbiodinium natans]